MGNSRGIFVSISCGSEDEVKELSDRVKDGV